jgi:hypothetical protein
MAAMRDRGVRLLKFLGRMAVYATFLAFVGMAVLTSIGIPGVAGPANKLPEIPAVDKAAMDKASNSQGGHILTSSGMKAVRVTSDKTVVDFLDEQEKHNNVANPGPYVVFSQGKPKVARPDPNTPPDAVVDVANGMIVASLQEYSNERGTVCYAATDTSQLLNNWAALDDYLRHKSMPLWPIPVSSDTVDNLKKPFTPTNCAVYPTS